MNKERLFYKPKSLETGDKIGLVNPVGEMNQKYAETSVPKVISFLKRSGYRVPEQRINYRKLIQGVQDPDVLADYYDPYATREEEIRLNPLTMERRSFLTFGGSPPQERARLFNQAVATCNAIFPLVGNRFGLDIAPYVDYDEFRKRRPIFITFSAASAFLLYLHLKTDTEVFYGPHIHFLVDREEEYTRRAFWDFLRQEEPQFVLRNIYSVSDGAPIGEERIPFFGYKVNQSGTCVSGGLMPIFLFSLERVIKQEVISFDPEGKILMMEADERSYEDCFAAIELIHRQIDLSNLSALVLASFVAFKPESSSLRNKLLNPDKAREFTLKVRALLKDNVPVVYGFPMGHSKYKLTIPMGIQAELNIETGDIILRESPFSNIYMK